MSHTTKDGQSSPPEQENRPGSEPGSKQGSEQISAPGSAPGSAKDAAGAEQTRAGASVMPKPTFSTFVLSLASSALVHLGEVPDPSTNTTSEDIALAKHSIDILTMLQDKIANGLDQDETRLLDGLLYELRIKYVGKR